MIRRHSSSSAASCCRTQDLEIGRSSSVPPKRASSRTGLGELLVGAAAARGQYAAPRGPGFRMTMGEPQRGMMPRAKLPTR